VDPHYSCLPTIELIRSALCGGSNVSSSMRETGNPSVIPMVRVCDYRRASWLPILLREMQTTFEESTMLLAGYFNEAGGPVSLLYSFGKTHNAKNRFSLRKTQTWAKRRDFRSPINDSFKRQTALSAIADSQRVSDSLT